MERDWKGNMFHKEPTNEYGEFLTYDGITQYPYLNNRYGYAGHFVSETDIKDGKYNRSQKGTFRACETYMNGIGNPSYRLIGLTVEEVKEAIKP